MKTTLLPVLAIVALGASNVVMADEACGTADQSTWMSEADVMDKATELGYTPSKVKIEDGCYEVYATKDGDRFEVFFNPVSGELVKVKDD